MTNYERDKYIIEMHTDIKWLKAGQLEHKNSHRKYVYYFITTFIAIALSWFR